MKNSAKKEYPSLKIEKIDERSKLPERAYSTDSGLDVFVHSFMKLYSDGEEIEISGDEKSVELDVMDRVLINTGLKVTVAPGYEIQIRPRSGLALKDGLTVLNTPATIDEQYRGPLGVIIVNLSGKKQKIEIDDKIAQIVIAEVCLSEIEVVDDLGEAGRGENSFGSTGKK